MNTENHKILVIGSSNVDISIEIDHFPYPGETVGNGKLKQYFGGKGANQAVAASRLGGNVEFVTFLGNDKYAVELKDYYKNNGINTNYLMFSEINPTGTALIYVSKEGENCIAVAPGSNDELTENSINNDIFDNVSLLIMQAEIPIPTIKKCIEIAHSKNIKIFFNPAPACKIEDKYLSYIDFLVVNHGELESISNFTIEEKGLDFITDYLLNKGVKNIIVTLGKDGLYYKSKNSELKLDAFDVNTVDTTGAGDTFCGALAVQLIKNNLINLDIHKQENIENQFRDLSILSDSLTYASAAAAISVTRLGAQPSIPDFQEVEEFLLDAKIN